jgi:hypothetical protein
MLRSSALKSSMPRGLTTTHAPEVRVRIGTITVSLETSDSRVRRMLEDRYSGFVTARTQPHFHFDVRIPSPPSPSSGVDVRVWREGTWWWVERGDFTAGWSTETRRGWIRQSANPYSADTLLRIVHSIALAETGGFLLHAASAVRNGRAFLLSGVSGAGKTTLTRLAPPDARILTDEISYVINETNGYSACGTPFAGELARVGENVSAPVAGIFFLEKANQNRTEEMDSAAGLRAILRNILFLANDPDLIQCVFHSAAEFVSSVPVRRLQFTPDARVWEMIA